MLLLNSTHPYLRILLPNGDYAAFVGGKLELDEDTPYREHILEVAKADAYTVIVEKAVVCPHCGEPFTGKSPKLSLATHVKAIHFDKWVDQQKAEQGEEINVEVKKREGFVCDACPNPALSTFGSEAELAVHVKALHAGAPELSADGETVKGEGRRPGERKPVEVPAAKATATATSTRGATTETVPHG